MVTTKSGKAYTVWLRRPNSWACGRAESANGFVAKAGPRGAAVFHGDFAPVEGDFAISFLDMIDVFVAGHLREHGVALPTVRRVYERLRQDLATAHPFCRRELLSEGKTVFLRGLDGRRLEELTDVLTRHKLYTQVLLPFLKRIEYAPDSLLARRWRITEQVIVDPADCFGKPIVEAVGIPTAVLAQACAANGNDAELVADWYNVYPGHVRAAVAFEKNLVA